MGFSKPSVQMDWINDDSVSKYTVPSAGDQLTGHVDDTNADNKIFNWCWWRVSHWIEFLDNTYDTNGNTLWAPKSTTITETIGATASTVTLDAGGIKSWDGSSNNSFSVTEAGAVQIGYAANNIITSSAGTTVVCTATSADLVKLHALTPSAADLNHLLGADGNGLVAADITKLAALTPSAADLNIQLGASGNGLIVADMTKLADTTSSAAELNILDGCTTTYDKLNYLNAAGLVAADLTKLANIDASDAEIDQLDGVTVGGSSAGDIATINATQTMTNKTLTNPKINENVLLLVTSTELNAVGVSGILGDGTAGRKLRTLRLTMRDGTVASTIKVEVLNIFNGDSFTTQDSLVQGGPAQGNILYFDQGSIKLLDAGITGTPLAVISSSCVACDQSVDTYVNARIVGNDIQVSFETNAGALIDLKTVLAAVPDNFDALITYITSA